MKDNLQRLETACGIPVYYSSGNTDLAAFHVSVKSGSRFEPIDGISHIMEHMSFKGTETRTKDEVRGTADRYGGTINAGTGYDWINYYINGHSDGAEEMYDVLCDMVCNPALKATELEPEKKVILQELAMRDNQPDSHFLSMTLNSLWRGSSRGHKIIGDEESINGTTVDDLRAFHESMYVRSNMAVFATGNIDPDMLVAKTDAAFGGLDAGVMNPTDGGVLNNGEYIHETGSDKTCYASIVWPTVLSRQESEAADVLSMILADGLTSRIYQELREKRALIYNTRTPFMPFLGSALFNAMFVATENNVREGLSAMAEVLADVKRNGVTQAELDNAKMKNSVRLCAYYESTTNRARVMQYQYNDWEDVITLDEAQRISDAVDLESVLAVAQKIMVPERMHVCVYGTENDGMKDFTLDELDI